MTWGSIAAGARIGKAAEPAFIASWTGLVASGLRNGDTVVVNDKHMPAHWAADHLARSFLRSSCDSLLMIDDDMEFQPGALERLRANVANHEYDIVMAFCTTRALPPTPILMQATAEDPGHIGLERFRPITRFTDGDVIEVDNVGLAFTLISRRVFEAMLGDDLSSTYFFTYGPGRETDDIPFCRSARRCGFRLAVDTSVKIEHIGRVPIGWEQLQKRRVT